MGGKQQFSDAAGWDLAGALAQYGTGDVTVNQMYVQFQIPVTRKQRVPVVFVHGSGKQAVLGVSRVFDTPCDAR